MKRGWIIRSFFIGLLLLCAGGWAWSSTRWYTVLMYTRASDGRGISCVTYNGTLTFTTGWSAHPGWDFDVFHMSGGDTTMPSVEGKDYDLTPPWSFDVPYWFLTLLSAALLLFVWRKTRLKVNPETAFPVEVKQSAVDEAKP